MQKEEIFIEKQKKNALCCTTKGFLIKVKRTPGTKSAYLFQCSISEHVKQRMDERLTGEVQPGTHMTIGAYHSLGLAE